MDTARKEMMLELIKERTSWNKGVVIKDLGDTISVRDDCGIVTGTLLESVQSVAKAFNAGYYVTTREGGSVLHIDVKEYEKVF